MKLSVFFRHQTYIKLVFFVFLFFNNTIYAQNEGTLVSELGKYSGYSEPKYEKFTVHSKYIKMPDGVHLAADIILPKKLLPSAKLPTILYLTRYGRSLRPRSFLKYLGYVTTTVNQKEIDLLVSHGYALVIVDVRGSGVSSGNRMYEFSPDEVADGKHIVDWVIQQPFSNKKVGITGISYLGTTAFLLLANQHPAVKAAVPICGIYNSYDDVSHPGGVFQEGFIKLWANTTQAMDRNDFSGFGFKAKYLITGVSPVSKSADSKKIMYSALKNRKNFDLYNELAKARARDDTSKKYNRTLDDFGVHSNIERIRKANVPIYIMSGWYDGAMVSSAFKAYEFLKKNQQTKYKLLIGPWSHGCKDYASPFALTDIPPIDYKIEILRFFDRYLKDIPNGIDTEPSEAYWNVGNENWVKGENLWSQFLEKHTRSYFSNQNIIEIKSDTNTYSGDGSRWNSLMPNYRKGPTGYPNLAQLHKNLFSYDFDIASESKTIVGKPLVRFSDLEPIESPIALFCYLEEVTSAGQIHYITEGITNANFINSDNIHPEKNRSIKNLSPVAKGTICVEFLPVIYTLKPDSKIRLVVATADKGHFVNYTPHNKILRFSPKSIANNMVCTFDLQLKLQQLR